MYSGDISLVNFQVHFKFNHKNIYFEQDLTPTMIHSVAYAIEILLVINVIAIILLNYVLQ